MFSCIYFLKISHAILYAFQYIIMIFSFAIFVKKNYDNKPIRHKKGKGSLFLMPLVFGPKNIKFGLEISITKVRLEYLGFAIRVVRILTRKIQVKLCVWIIYTIFELVHGMKWNILVLFESIHVFFFK